MYTYYILHNMFIHIYGIYILLIWSGFLFGSVLLKFNVHIDHLGVTWNADSDSVSIGLAWDSEFLAIFQVMVMVMVMVLVYGQYFD